MKRWASGAFWGDLFERMVRTAAQAALGVIGAGTMGLLDVNWPTLGSVAGLAAVVAFLTSMAAGATGDPVTASFSKRSLRQVRR